MSTATSQSRTIVEQIEQKHLGDWQGFCSEVTKQSNQGQLSNHYSQLATALQQSYDKADSTTRQALDSMDTLPASLITILDDVQQVHQNKGKQQADAVSQFINQTMKEAVKLSPQPSSR